MKNTKRKTFLEYLNNATSDYPSNYALTVGMLQDMISEAMYRQNFDMDKEFAAINLYDFKEELDLNALLNDANKILIHLIAYGLIETIKTVEYPSGTYKNFIEQARLWLKNYEIYKNKKTLNNDV